MTAFWCCLLVLTLGAPSSGTGTTTAPDVIAQLKRAKPAGITQTLRLDEAEVNAFIVSSLASRGNRNIERLRLDFSPDGDLTALAVVIVREDRRRSFPLRLLNRLLAGQYIVRAEGIFQTKNGKGSYRPHKVRVNGAWAPAWVSRALIGIFTKRQPPYVDITEEFPLPYGISEIRFGQDWVEILR